MDRTKQKLYNISKKIGCKFIVKTQGEYIISRSSTNYYEIKIYEYDDQTKGCDIFIQLHNCGMEVQLVRKYKIEYCVASDIIDEFIDRLAKWKKFCKFCCLKN